MCGLLLGRQASHIRAVLDLGVGPPVVFHTAFEVGSVSWHVRNLTNFSNFSIIILTLSALSAIKSAIRRGKADGTRISTRFFLRCLPCFELGDLEFKVGESRFEGRTPIVFRRGVGGCGIGSGEAWAVRGGGRQEVGEGLYPAAFADRKPPDEWAVWVFDEPS